MESQGDALSTHVAYVETAYVESASPAWHERHGVSGVAGISALRC